MIDCFQKPVMKTYILDLRCSDDASQNVATLEYVSRLSRQLRVAPLCGARAERLVLRIYMKKKQRTQFYGAGGRSSRIIMRKKQAFLKNLCWEKFCDFHFFKKSIVNYF